ncbi:hypothetical protein [Schumannella sp. 10F1B-5-1]|uniref:hypothetical protein n=1 Tax=Schumannella sp. 10F1B-5-1 TaxID=2590780 RepID=UPI001130EAFF|nr:hypothetical protein [Schumannella sp. 10F1B-5-1]TPW72796.1 hypothetical protein FJ658_05870 [Schumannella sp. 10F1B-5-1]
MTSTTASIAPHRTALRRTALVAGLGALAAASLLLTGCTAIMNTVHKVHEESFDDHAAAAKGWVGVQTPEWIPAKATEIGNVATNDETNAVITATGGDLPDWCVEMPRQGLPFDTRFGEVGLPERVERCGDYEVVKQDGTWIGWYSARSEGAKPSPGAVPVSPMTGAPEGTFTGASTGATETGDDR